MQGAHMKKNRIAIACIVNFIGINAFAGTMDSFNTISDLPWVVSLSAGPAWANAGDTQTFNLTQTDSKTYAAHDATNTLFAGELFLGMQRTLMPQLQGQFGLAVAKTGDAQLQGTIWDDADPAFANYNYDYYVQTTRIAAKAKLLLDKGFWMTPWISASVGVGLNRAHSFDSTPLIPQAAASNNFSGNTQTSFSYTLGVGFQKSICANWEIGIGYEFADWGRSQLGTAPGQTTGSSISLNHLYTQGLMFNLTYLK
jgi:opacity protein-like surface antigen